MKIRLARPISTDSIVDGIGLRTVIWTQGCPHACKGCHNPTTWNTTDGTYYEVDKLVNEILAIELQSGVTFSGGEPFIQSETCAAIAKQLKVYNTNIWCYTGFLYEDLIKNDRMIEFLKYVDVLIDGPFVESLKTYDARFRGSSNQRLIDVQKSLIEGKTILLGNL